jgi:CheY-like chemotaxis protein
MALTKRTARLVVLIDDNQIDNMIHTALLQRKQFAQEIYTFVNSVEALAAIKKLTEKVDSGTEFPDYIFLDMGMPVMDGFSFLNEYEKLDQELLKECKLIILTSSIAPEGKKESLKRESVAGYISKPLTEEALSALFNNRLSAS